MEHVNGISYSTALFQIIGLWIVIILVVFFLIKGILRGNSQKRNEKIIELEKRIKKLEMQVNQD